MNDFVGRFIKFDGTSVVIWNGDRNTGHTKPGDIFLVIEKGYYYYRCLSRLGYVELDNCDVDRFGYTVD